MNSQVKEVESTKKDDARLSEIIEEVLNLSDEEVDSQLAMLGFRDVKLPEDLRQFSCVSTEEIEVQAPTSPQANKESVNEKNDPSTSSRTHLKMVSHSSSLDQASSIFAREFAEILLHQRPLYTSDKKEGGTVVLRDVLVSSPRKRWMRSGISGMGSYEAKTVLSDSAQYASKDIGYAGSSIVISPRGKRGLYFEASGRGLRKIFKKKSTSTRVLPREDRLGRRVVRDESCITVFSIGSGGTGTGSYVTMTTNLKTREYPIEQSVPQFGTGSSYIGWNPLPSHFKSDVCTRGLAAYSQSTFHQASQCVDVMAILNAHNQQSHHCINSEMSGNWLDSLGSAVQVMIRDVDQQKAVCAPLSLWLSAMGYNNGCRDRTNLILVEPSEKEFALLQEVSKVNHWESALKEIVNDVLMRISGFSLSVAPSITEEISRSTEPNLEGDSSKQEIVNSSRTLSGSIPKPDASRASLIDKNPVILEYTVQ